VRKGISSIWSEISLEICNVFDAVLASLPASSMLEAIA